MIRVIKAFALSILCVLFFVGCAHEYKYKPIPVRDASAYPNAQDVMGARVGAEAFYDKGDLKEIFGFDLKAAGVVPVQIAIDNLSANPLALVYGAKVLDSEGRWWEILPDNVVMTRVNDYTSGGLSGEGVMQKSLLYGLAGGVVGAAVGVVSGTNIGEAAGKGAAIGGALGASSEIISMQQDPGNPAAVAQDFSGRNFDQRVIPAHVSDHGLLYFPAEMSKPTALRLYFKSAVSAKTAGSKRKSASPNNSDVHMVEFRL